MGDIEEIDVLILGGGINGCGTFRDLAAQGVDCLLLERDDFCAGASSGSSRLMHGGLKYLETGEFRLVRESVEERNHLLRNAPHYVFPLECIIPLSSRLGGIVPSAMRFLGMDAKMNDRGTLITRAGLMLYDFYGRKINALPGHRMLSRDDLDAMVPGLDGDVIAGALYYEGRITHAERLGLELVLDGEALHEGARALNHATVTGAEGDVVTYAHGGRTYHVRPKVIVNAGGAWIDQVNAALGIETNLMGGSKGAHLVVDNPDLFAALDGRMVYFGTADGRVNLVYPFMSKVLVGSTDIKVDDPDEARCSDEEAQYLMSVVPEIFPGITIAEDQIRHRFSGVRPLPSADGDVGKVTRDHSIARADVSGVPVLCLIGGKWTTFRRFSEETADEVLEELGRARRRSTRDMAIGGGKDWPDDRAAWIARHARDTGLSEDRVGTLLDRYGTRAADFARVLAGGDTALDTLPDYSREELSHILRTERAADVDDLLERRTPVAISGRRTPEVESEVGRLFDLERVA